MLKDITVLLTGVGAPGAPGIIRCLRKNGERNIKIVGVDMNHNAGGRSMVDVFHIVPAAGDERFIPSILNICLSEKVDIVQPLVTRELSKFAKTKTIFGKENIKVAVMDHELLEVANNKGKLLSRLREHNIPVPKFYVVNSVEEIEEVCAKLGYPQQAVCVKQTVSNGSRGLRIVNPFVSKFKLFFEEKPNSILISYGELIETLKEQDSIPEMMVMEYLPGKEYCIDVLADKGKLIQAVCRNGELVISSIHLDCTVVDEPSIISMTSTICEVLQSDGNLGLDIKCNAYGKPLIMEINPRLNAGVVASAAGGVNFPYLGIKLLLGESFEIPPVRYGTKMVRHWQEIFMDSNGQVIQW